MRQTVVMVPGMMSSTLEMSLLRHRLPYTCEPLDFDTITTPIPESGEYLRDVIRSMPGIVHVVAFSMGGLSVIHAYAGGNMPPGRVVMLGTPVLGSSRAKIERDCPTGFVVRKTWARGFDGDLPRWDQSRQIGIIGGSEDQTVPAHETRMAGADHLVLPVTHSEMLSSPDVADQVQSFLSSGSWAGGKDNPIDVAPYTPTPRKEPETAREVLQHAGARVVMRLFQLMCLIGFLVGKGCERAAASVPQGSFRWKIAKAGEVNASFWRLFWSTLAGLAWRARRRTLLRPD